MALTLIQSGLLKSFRNRRIYRALRKNDEVGIAEYISSMSNAAAMHGEENAYLVWGVHNDTYELTNTSFSYHRDVKGEPLEHILVRQIIPDIGFSFHEFTIDDKRVVVLVIPPAKNVPTAFNNIRFLRIGSF